MPMASAQARLGPRAPGPRRRRRRWGRPDGGRREQHPGDRQVAGGITGAHVAPVDDGGQPPWRTTRLPGWVSPWTHTGGRSQGGAAVSSSHRRRRRGPSTASPRGSSAPAWRGPPGQRDAAVRVGGSVGRAGRARRPGTPRAARRLARGPSAATQRRRAGEPGAHRSTATGSRTRPAEPHRRRDRQREAGRQLRQPALLVLHERHGQRPAGEAHHQVVAEPEQHVVPPVGHELQRPVGEVGVLLGEQGAHERVVDLHLGGGHVLGRHVAAARRG